MSTYIIPRGDHTSARSISLPDMTPENIVKIELGFENCFDFPVFPYEILDDIAVDEYKSRQIKTNPKTGLTDEDVEKAIEFLKG